MAVPSTVLTATSVSVAKLPDVMFTHTKIIPAVSVVSMSSVSKAVDIHEGNRIIGNFNVAARKQCILLLTYSVFTACLKFVFRKLNCMLCTVVGGGISPPPRLLAQAHTNEFM